MIIHTKRNSSGYTDVKWGIRFGLEVSKFKSLHSNIAKWMNLGPLTFSLIYMSIHVCTHRITEGEMDILKAAGRTSLHSLLLVRTKELLVKKFCLIVF